MLTILKEILIGLVTLVIFLLIMRIVLNQMFSEIKN